MTDGNATETNAEPDDGILRGAHAATFSYDEAFSRNLGWITAYEQQVLRRKRVALAGLGGVGGSQLLALTRLGVGGFSIADFDRFELANFNRQAGATMSALGQPKAETMAQMARDINPEVDLEVFAQGVNEGNFDTFLSRVDVFVDSLDFFELDIRRKLFARCAALNIPAITAAPIGMGTGYLIFLPGGMSFEDWFRLEGLPRAKQQVNFALGVTPRGFQRGYLVDSSRVDLVGRRGPSTSVACELCAGVTAAEVVKLLLRRGPIRAVPRYQQFDAYRGKFVRGWLPGGNANPWQRLKLKFGYRLSERLTMGAMPPAVKPANDIEAILDKARWAPSGDNCQPWRFTILSKVQIRVRLTAQSQNDLFDYRDGESTLLAGGMLLETMRIAASAQARACEWAYERRLGSVHHILVTFSDSTEITADPLLSFIPIRSVDRRPYRLTPLTEQQKELLEQTHGPELKIEWHTSTAERWQFARLAGKATQARLSTPEVFQIHREVLDWTHPMSQTGIPASAAGLSRLSLGVTRWAMRDWRRMRMLNSIGARRLAALEMDYRPALFCAGFFVVRLAQRGSSVETGTERLLRAGQAIQRFWLTATQLGLSVQPSMATPIFAHYGANDQNFTSDRAAARKAGIVAKDFARLGLGEDVIFMGRIGVPAPPVRPDRSVRRTLRDLIIAPAEDDQ